MAIAVQAKASRLVPLLTGSPKKIIMPSPINLSMVPPYFKAIRDISVRYWFNRSVKASASICSERAEKPTMSEKKTTSFLRWVSSLTWRSEEHTSELQSRPHLVCRLLLEKKKKI